MVSSRKKNQMVCLRYNASELKDLDAKADAAGLTRSTYIRRKIAGEPVAPPRVPKINWQAYKELTQITRSLSAIGNNLNQIARAMNAARWEGETLPDNLPSPEQLTEAVAQLQKTQAIIHQFQLDLCGA